MGGFGSRSIQDELVFERKMATLPWRAEVSKNTVCDYPKNELTVVAHPLIKGTIGYGSSDYCTVVPHTVISFSHRQPVNINVLQVNEHKFNTISVFERNFNPKIFQGNEFQSTCEYSLTNKNYWATVKGSLHDNYLMNEIASIKEHAKAIPITKNEARKIKLNATVDNFINTLLGNKKIDPDTPLMVAYDKESNQILKYTL